MSPRREADPRLDIAKLSVATAPERGKVYDSLGLDYAARVEVELRVRAAIRKRFRGNR
jgi:hypothetical protein